MTFETIAGYLLGTIGYTTGITVSFFGITAGGTTTLVGFATGTYAGYG